jgi:hypothetical protein
MRDQNGELQYFIGVQLDGSEYVEPERKRLSEKTEKEGSEVVRATAKDIDGAVRELPDANMVSIDTFLFPAVYTCLLFANVLTQLV